jgi:hypothetical protein
MLDRIIKALQVCQGLGAELVMCSMVPIYSWKINNPEDAHILVEVKLQLQMPQGTETGVLGLPTESA